MPALTLALALAACGGTARKPERVFNMPPPSAKPGAPLETRVPKPSPAALALISAVPVARPANGQRHARKEDAAASGSGTAAAAHAADPAPPPAADAPPPAAVRTAAPMPPGLPAVVYFDVDHYRVRPRDRQLLQQHAAVLKANPDLVLLLRGHADGLGPPDYNQALADKRAEMVGRVLASMGVDLQQLRQESVVAPSPAPGATPPKPQAEDRRVELVYLAGGAVAGR